MIDNINVLEENKMNKAANVAKGSKVISRQKTQIIIDFEKILHDIINFFSLLLNVKQLNGDSLSAAFICEYL